MELKPKLDKGIMLKRVLFSVIVLQQWLFLGDCKSYQSERSNCENHSVVGRDPANPKEYPYTALIFHKHERDIKWLCVGTLISSRFVLTVAHCFLVPEIPNRVRLRELDFDSTDDDASPIDLSIKNYTLHPNYDFDTHLNDIALIELDAEVQFNDYIMPACLPLAVDELHFKKFTEVGWNLLHTDGNSTQLLTAGINQIGKASCLAIFGTEIKFNNTLQICARSLTDRSVDCQLSTGSPIVVDHPDYRCLVMGILSYGPSDCSDTISPNLYTRVPAFIDWIRSII